MSKFLAIALLFSVYGPVAISSTEVEGPIDVADARFSPVVSGSALDCNDFSGQGSPSWLSHLPAAQFVSRIGGSGDWAVVVPHQDWGRPATSKSSLTIVNDSSQSVSVNARRFIEFVGPRHFVASDPEFNRYLFDHKGNGILFVPKTFAVSDRYGLARQLPGTSLIQIWMSITSYYNKQEAEVKWDLQDSGQHGEQVAQAVSVQWLDERYLAAETGTELGKNNQVAVFDLDHGTEVACFKNAWLMGVPKPGNLCISSTSGGGGTLVSVRPENRGLAFVRIDLSRGEYLTESSPDGRYIIVNQHGNEGVPIAPVASIRESREPDVAIKYIQPSSPFSGWVKCSSDDQSGE